MRLINFGRITILTGMTLLSAVIVATSAVLNARSTPRFRNGDLLFPFILGLISLVLYPLVIYIGRPRTNTPGRRLWIPPFVEFPFNGIMALIWGAAAHMDTVAWFPTFTGCNHAAAGTIDPMTGLSVPGVCRTLWTAHGSSWLMSLILASLGVALLGLPYLYFWATRGWTTTVWTTLSEAEITRPAKQVPV